MWKRVSNLQQTKKEENKYILEVEMEKIEKEKEERDEKKKKLFES